MKIPGVLSGTSPLVRWLNDIRRALIGLQIRPGRGYRVRESSEGTTLELLGLGGGGGADVVLYDPANACCAGTFYKVRSTDAAAVSGVDYTVNGVAAKTKATPSKYLCLQSTAPNTSDSFTAAHVPQLPDLISTDPKADGKHWEWFSPSTVCTANGAVEV